MPVVTRFVIEPLSIALTEPFGIAGGAQQRAENVLVRLRLDDGTDGFGEAAPFAAVTGETQALVLDTLERLSSIVVGADVMRWRHLATILREAAADVPSARCAVESAVLDALCRRAGLSLRSFFGGAQTELWTDITIVTGDAERAEAAARRATARGFTTLKVKVGGAPFEHDAARLRAIARAAPAAALLLDANGSLSADEAVALIDVLDGARSRVVLFEQPTAAHDLDGLARVRESGRIPVAADESVSSAADVVRVARAVDVVNVKIMKSGLVETLDIVAVARAHGLGLMVGGMVESELAMAVSAALAAGLGGFSFIDLDTPLFMENSPFEGGFHDSPPRLVEAETAVGHGVRPRR